MRSVKVELACVPLAAAMTNELTTSPADDFNLRYLADTSLFFSRPLLWYWKGVKLDWEIDASHRTHEVHQI
jgi:hypothetical protein